MSETENTGMTEDEKLDAKIRQQVMESQRAAIEYQMQCDAVMRRRVFATKRVLEDGTAPSGKSGSPGRYPVTYDAKLRVCYVHRSNNVKANRAVANTTDAEWFDQAMRVYEDQAGCNLEYSE